MEEKQILTNALKDRLDTLTRQIAELQHNLDSDKSDFGKLTWLDVGDFAYINNQLEIVLKYWNNESD